MENRLEISDDQLAHFERNGFFLIPNPLGAQGVREVDSRQQEVEPEWERTEFPSGCNQLACLFLMIGESVLQMVERHDLVMRRGGFWALRRYTWGPAASATPRRCNGAKGAR